MDIIFQQMSGEEMGGGKIYAKFSDKYLLLFPTIEK